MTQAQFSRLVDEKTATGMPWPLAIAEAARESATQRDPFDVMREKALGK